MIYLLALLANVLKQVAIGPHGIEGQHVCCLCIGPINILEVHFASKLIMHPWQRHATREKWSTFDPFATIRQFVFAHSPFA